MAINIIVAMGKNGVIGKDNKLIWHLPEDLKFFKRATTDNVVVFGRKTFEGIGRPLPNRDNVILTQNQGYIAEGCTVVNNLAQMQVIINQAEREAKEVFVAGGSEIYKLFLPLADNLFITEIDQDFEGDAFFPKYNKEEWKLIGEQKGIKNTENPYDYSFKVYIKQVLTNKR